LYDARANIISQFSSSKISGTGKYSTEYVELHLRERNPKGERSYNNSRGIIILERPEALRPNEKDIGGLQHKLPTRIVCKLYIWVTPDVNYQYDTFINTIINEFQSTIIQNQTTIVSNGDINFDGCENLDTGSQHLIGVAMLVSTNKYESNS